MKKFYIIVIGIFFIFVLASLATKGVKSLTKTDLTPASTSNVTYQSDDTQISRVRIGGQTLIAELAITPYARERGLSGRASLEEGVSMLFIFDVPGAYPFWMKDMHFPIDIIWMNQNREVIYIKENATPESYPTNFGPEGRADAKYVLETSAGFSKRINLKIGDIAEFLH